MDSDSLEISVDDSDSVSLDSDSLSDDCQFIELDELPLSVDDGRLLLSSLEVSDSLSSSLELSLTALEVVSEETDSTDDDSTSDDDSSLDSDSISDEVDVVVELLSIEEVELSLVSSLDVNEDSDPLSSSLEELSLTSLEVVSEEEPDSLVTDDSSTELDTSDSISDEVVVELLSIEELSLGLVVLLDSS